MKLFSSRGAKVSKEYKASKAKPRDPAQQMQVRSHVQIPVKHEDLPQDIKQPVSSQDNKHTQIRHDTAPPQAPDTSPQAAAPAAQAVPKHIYPEATLSEKQLAALHKVLGPSIDQVPGQMTLGQGFTQSPLVDPLQSDVAFTKAIEIKDKGIAKIVTFIVFLFLILSAAAFAGWYYWWTTYATFEYSLQPVAVLKGQSIDANDFLEPGEEMNDVSAAFVNPRFEQIPGLQYISLTLTKGWRTVDTAAALFILTPIDSIEHEFSVEGTLSRLTDFLTNAGAATDFPFTIRFVEDPLPLEDYPVGEFPLHLAVNDFPFTVTLNVVDTTPPVAVAVPVHTIIGEDVQPEYFVTDVFDASPIHSVTFVEEPNVMSVMELTQPVRIAIEDIFGNVGFVFSELTIELNRDPPFIEGTVDTIESEVGTSVDYPLVLTAYDDFGRELEVMVDNSGVDENTEGTYTAVYWAEDLSGLRTDIEVTVHIIAAAPEYIIQRADEILNGIIRDNMTQAQKVLAINNWVRWTITPADPSGNNSESTIANAFTAIRDKRGDYIVISAISELLLTRAGVPNMPIDRIPEATTSHRWNLVNPDGRGWFHFDAFPTGLGYGGDRMSMFTSSDAETYAERIETRSGIKDYYKYDSGSYPEIAR